MRHAGRGPREDRGGIRAPHPPARRAHAGRERAEPRHPHRCRRPPHHRLCRSLGGLVHALLLRRTPESRDRPRPRRQPCHGARGGAPRGFRSHDEHRGLRGRAAGARLSPERHPREHPQQHPHGPVSARADRGRGPAPDPRLRHPPVGRVVAPASRWPALCSPCCPWRRSVPESWRSSSSRASCRAWPARRWDSSLHSSP